MSQIGYGIGWIGYGIGDWERPPVNGMHRENLKFTGLTHNFPVDPAV
jgi:hypothetical protein